MFRCLSLCLSVCMYIHVMYDSLCTRSICLIRYTEMCGVCTLRFWSSLALAGYHARYAIAVCVTIKDFMLQNEPLLMVRYNTYETVMEKILSILNTIIFLLR